MATKRVGTIAAGIPAYSQEAAPAKSEIEKIVKEYILQHPEVLLESVRLYQERQQNAERDRARDAVASKSAELFRDVNSPASGPASGKVSEAIPVVQFFDYRCGYCKRVRPAIEKLLASNPNVRLVFKEFPILGPDSILASKAALAARKQNAYFKFHEALMGLTGMITMEAIGEIATKNGLDVAKLKADMEAKDVDETIQANQKLAMAVGVTATPTFVIGKEVHAGALDLAGFQELIEKTRGAAPPAAAK